MIAHHHYLAESAYWLNAQIYRLILALEPAMSAEADAVRAELTNIANNVDTLLGNLAASKAEVAQLQADAADDKQALVDAQAALAALNQKMAASQ